MVDGGGGAGVLTEQEGDGLTPGRRRDGKHGLRHVFFKF